MAGHDAGRGAARAADPAVAGAVAAQALAARVEGSGAVVAAVPALGEPGGAVAPGAAGAQGWAAGRGYRRRGLRREPAHAWPAPGAVPVCGPQAETAPIGRAGGVAGGAAAVGRRAGDIQYRGGRVDPDRGVEEHHLARRYLVE